jgi:hypothetical protein
VIKHIIQVQIENEEATATYPGTGTVLDKLAASGVFLQNYFATGHSSLDNYIAQISGQAQYAFTSGDCEGTYRDNEGTVDGNGFYHPLGTPQVSPADSPDPGCVYPASVKTLADQLTAAGLPWHGYMEDMGNDPNRETATCGIPEITSGVPIDPAVGGVDRTNTAESTDQYAARHNPFVYFHSLIDAPLVGGASPCAADVTNTDTLLSDLNSAHPPAYAWITPNLCNDGHDSPCTGPGAEGGDPGAGGLVSANAYLATIIPQIEQSAAFKDSGLIVITTDEGATDDSCCGESGSPGEQTTGGGGRTGAVLLSDAITPHISTCDYNHFSALRTYEDLFDLTPAMTGINGSDGEGHLAHAGDAGVAPFTQELTATSDPCAPVPNLSETAFPAAFLALGAVSVVVLPAALHRRSRVRSG